MADYTVAGTLSPDATGDYTQNGTYNSQPCYDRDGDAAYWIWFDGAVWVISAVLGFTGEDPYWGGNATIVGNYTPTGGASGTATVAAPAGTFVGLHTAGGDLLLSV